MQACKEMIGSILLLGCRCGLIRFIRSFGFVIRFVLVFRII
jgi:hypothetical protein